MSKQERITGRGPGYAQGGRSGLAQLSSCAERQLTIAKLTRSQGDH